MKDLCVKNGFSSVSLDTETIIHGVIIEAIKEQGRCMTVVFSI